MQPVDKFGARGGGTKKLASLQERLADLEDLTELRKAKRAEGGKRSVPLADVKRRLGIR